MGCKNNLKDFLYNIDLFGKEPKLYYKGKSKIKTLYGTISTIIYAIIYISFFAYKLNLMLKKTDVNYYETTVNTEKIPSIQLTNEIFYPCFALINIFTDRPFIDESIYYIQAYFGEKENSTKKLLNIEKCKIENFDSKYGENSKNRGDFYCIKDINELLEGNVNTDNFSYFSIEIVPCINQSFCAPPSTVRAYLSQSVFLLYLNDVELTPQIYKNPVKFWRREIELNIQKDHFDTFTIDLKKIKIETDEDNIGFNENIETKNYLKYDAISIDSWDNYDNIFECKGCSISEVRIQLSESVFTISRKYTKLIDVLGTVGGFMGVIYSCFQVCISFLVDILYEISLINNLFAVDLDKNSLIIKSLKTEKIENLKKEIRIKEIKQKKDLKDISSSERKNYKSKINNLENYDDSNSKKTINLDGTKIIDNNFYNENENNISNINDLNKEHVDKENEIECKRDKEEKVNIKEINLNIFRDYFCFCCKKNNSQKKILNEAIKIIYEKYDIINLFRILYFYDINKNQKDK